MKKMIVAAAVAAMTAGGAVALRTIVSQSDPIFEANVEALTQLEHSLNCIPDKNSLCVDGDYRLIEPHHYYLQH